ncbi:hypothetical protein [Hyphococcus luteus]|uniref:Uncharacterized protein n=1 Tax=Hyphococcus luteus TaxID=2058213 RepID=A0A2S7K5T4_9PROT|nr:hypothetical protein [Marinicaulis flavus]PQA87808.1 hypothetical protein CW354_05500 [Marinicaulis flavus]
MQVSAAARSALFKRALLNLAAIAAVTAIFALKEAEWEKRAVIEQSHAPKLAEARADLDS